MRALAFHVSNNLNPSMSHGPSEALAVTQRCLRVLFPVPMNIGGDEFQPGHTPIRTHVEDDTRCCAIVSYR